MSTKYTIDFIRQSWFDIFVQNNYLLLEPISLIPEEDDKSLLFINSGVATLKKYFSGNLPLLSRNLVNCQPVIRTKDIDQINEWSYHQTLFEMLGNFSIGGNFKLEAISIVWEWFTSDKWLRISPEQLFITVWEKDEISQKIVENLSIAKNHVILGSKKSNFWDMGDGPCGPNIEIYYDYQPNEILPSKIEHLEDKRFIEIANIVFPEFYHSSESGYLPLREKCVDCGVGLERIAMVLQGKKNTFSIDLWQPIIELIESYANGHEKKQ